MESQPRFENFLFIYNPEKTQGEAVAGAAAEQVRNAGRAAQVVPAIREGDQSRSWRFPQDEALGNADVVIVLGGDGTFLSVIRTMVQDPKPILGVNLGHFGYLTETTVEALDRAVADLLRGYYRILRRSLLEAKILRQKQNDEEVLFASPAANEALMTRAETGRLLQLTLHQGRFPALAYNADGLIVSTPTGSTGHSLSAGGPIIEPDLKALVVTPVCPHSLMNRPLVFKGDEELRFKFPEDMGEIVLTLDGQIRRTCGAEDIISVRREYAVPTIVFPDHTFLDVLRGKFGIGEVSNNRR